METLGSRVRARRNQLGLSQKALGEKAALSQTGVDSVEKRGDVIPRRIDLMAEALGVSIKWLLTGEDEPSPAADTSTQAFQPENESIRQTSSPHVNVEHSRELSGEIVEIDPRGEASGVSKGEEMHSPVAKWLLPLNLIRHELHVRPDQTIIVENIGDAMSPTLDAGDRVLVDTQDTEPDIDGLYAIARGKKTIIRRLEPIPESQPEQIKIKADNERHETYTVQKDSVRIVGRAVGKFSKL